ncbi:MAG: hypothetical protein IIC02_08085 [Planctomycetes bacterium]|nr:hypothetical protein [Planctomycetota bacterium]
MNSSLRVKATLALVSVLFLLTTGCAPRTFVRSAPGWKVIEFREGLVNNYDEAWQKTVDTIARNWDIEVLDKDSGYLRTAWLHGIVGASYERYRGRLTIKYPRVKNADKLEVKTDAQWLATQPLGWVSGFDSTFQRDVYSALSGRLGRTVPAE